MKDRLEVLKEYIAPTAPNPATSRDFFRLLIEELSYIRDQLAKHEDTEGGK